MRYLLKAVTGLSLLSFAFAAHAEPETYTLDPSHTSVGWEINHFGFSDQFGKFANVDGTLVLDEANPAASKVNATISMVNLVTGVPKLDEHLKTPDFFNAASFPTATFASDKVEVTGKNTAKVYGTLTIRGVAKPVTLDVTLNKIGINMMNKKTAGFAASTTVKRSDFGMTKYIPMLGDDVKLIITSEANVAQPVPATPKALQQ